MAVAPPRDATLRAARMGDADRLAEIDARVNASPWNADMFRDSLEHVEGLVISALPGLVSGFVIYRVVGEDVEILNIAVHPGAQRCGYGRRLLRTALEGAMKNGARYCFLEVRESNAAAQALYASFGFVESGRRRDYYRADSGREDALLLSHYLV